MDFYCSYNKSKQKAKFTKQLLCARHCALSQLEKTFWVDTITSSWLSHLQQVHLVTQFHHLLSGGEYLILLHSCEDQVCSIMYSAQNMPCK